MKHSLTMGLIALTLATGAFAFEKKHEKALAEEVKNLGFTKTKDRFLDSVYLKPGVNFKEYLVLEFATPDTSKVTVREPSGPNDFDEPWVLTDKDKVYLQEKLVQSYTEELIDTKRFKAGVEGKKLLVKTTFIELAPTAPKDDIKSRPTISKIYTEGAGDLTLKIELYDAQTNALVGAISDESTLGNRWERNDRANNRRQLGLAFDRIADSLGDLLEKK